jgi:hypothetical protein
MSKCSVKKCPKYTSDGKMLELNNGVVAWMPLRKEHKESMRTWETIAPCPSIRAVRPTSLRES